MKALLNLIEKVSIDDLATALIIKVRCIPYEQVEALKNNPNNKQKKDTILTLLDEVAGLVKDITEESKK